MRDFLQIVRRYLSPTIENKLVLLCLNHPLIKLGEMSRELPVDYHITCKSRASQNAADLQ